MNPAHPRRRWLQSTSALLAAPMLRRAWPIGVAAGLAGLGRPAGAATPDEAWASSFRPFAAPGFGGELRTDRVPVEGRLPPALRGTFYRNGPARFQRGGQRLAHWFDGDGMLQALRFDGQGGLAHLGRMIDTPKARAEAEAGRFLYGGFGSTVANPAPVPDADVMNPGNINLLPMADGRLYALWEAGSAIEIDPASLQARGLHDWSPETRHAPFSAHPRVAADGTVWNFGYLSGTGRLLVYQIAPNGQLQRQTVLALPQVDLVHDFAVTERHLVFLLPPFRFERGDGPLPNLMAGLRWMPEAPLRVAVVDMADFASFVTELPHGGVFHLGNAWEAGGQIHLGYVRHPAMDQLLLQLRVHDRVPGLPALPASQWCQVQIDPARRSARQQATELSQVEFPRWDARRTGQPTRLTVLLQRSAAAETGVFGFDSVLALSADGAAQRHVYGPGWIAEEHILVPEPGRSGEAEGWILGTAYHWPSQRSALSVFRADRLADGPVAQARLPYGLPLGLHGQFVPA